MAGSGTHLKQLLTAAAFVHPGPGVVWLCCHTVCRPLWASVLHLQSQLELIVTGIFSDLQSELVVLLLLSVQAGLIHGAALLWSSNHVLCAMLCGE